MPDEPQRSWRALLLAGLILLPLLSGAVAYSPASPAFADACDSSRGLQPRVLETDDVGRVEKQYCMGGEWTTYLVLQYDASAERRVITETVEDPLSLNLNIDARSFFELKNYDPYAIVQTFRDRADALGKVPDSEVELRLKAASAKAQGQLRRGIRDDNENCRVRSVLTSARDVRFGGRWLGAVGIGTPGDTHITFEIAPDVPPAAVSAILTAIDQYHYAVISQDSALAYPENIVPRAPDDPADATIRFEMANVPPPPDPSRVAAAWTVADLLEKPPWGEPVQWKTGAISLNSATVGEVTPATIGHEIGHVLGIEHLPSEVEGRMSATAIAPNVPWTPTSRTDSGNGIAFDDCMFLPTERPLL